MEMTADQKAFLVTALILGVGSLVMVRLVNKFTAWIDARSARRLPLFSPRAPLSPAAPAAMQPPRYEGPPPAHVCSVADAPRIADGLQRLVAVGLRPRPGFAERFDEVAEAIAEETSGISYSRAPTAGDFALSALQGGESDASRAFENARLFEDHCYDVAELEDYPQMIGEIVALAGNEWPIKRIVVTNARDPSTRDLDRDGPYRVAIEADPPVSPFELTEGKDFDWSLIFHLNERLPPGATGRFAMFFDGNATIVYLPPEKIEKLNALCGYEFFYEDKNEGEGQDE